MEEHWTWNYDLGGNRGKWTLLEWWHQQLSCWGVALAGWWGLEAVDSPGLCGLCWSVTQTFGDLSWWSIESHNNPGWLHPRTRIVWTPKKDLWAWLLCCPNSVETEEKANSPVRTQHARRVMWASKPRSLEWWYAGASLLCWSFNVSKHGVFAFFLLPEHF